jgi:hypothetical protein
LQADSDTASKGSAIQPLRLRFSMIPTTLPGVPTVPALPHPMADCHRSGHSRPFENQ